MTIAGRIKAGLLFGIIAMSAYYLNGKVFDGYGFMILFILYLIFVNSYLSIKKG